MKISYAVTVCNEVDEFKRLISFLIKNISTEDEIVVLCDSTNTNIGIKHECEHWVQSDPRFSYYEFALDNNFSKFKNYLISICSGDYIFQLDADEIPNAEMIKKLPQLLEENDDVDVFLVPRINTLVGERWEINSYIHSQKWKTDSVQNEMIINWPDFQMRIFKHNGKIKFERPVHEILTGYNIKTFLPWEKFNFDWALRHEKRLERQKKQNEFYSKL